jgi:hypothetical protein
MLEKIYFKFFLVFFILVLIVGGLFFGIKGVKKETKDGVTLREEEAVTSSSLEEVLPSGIKLLPTASPKTEIKEFELSSSGKIGQFASGWDWARRRNQDGRYGETSLRIEIDSGREIREVILFFNPVYSGEGEVEYEVYISDKKQVKEKDEKHNFSSWWVGDEAELGQKVRGEGFKCSSKEEIQAWEVTDFVRQKGGGEYFVAFLNKAKVGISVSEVYLRVLYK